MMSPVGERSHFTSESLNHNPENEIQKQKEGMYGFEEVSNPVPSPWSPKAGTADGNTITCNCLANRVVGTEKGFDYNSFLTHLALNFLNPQTS
jgi:hypothetical protein